MSHVMNCTRFAICRLNLRRAERLFMRQDACALYPCAPFQWSAKGVGRIPYQHQLAYLVSTPSLRHPAFLKQRGQVLEHRIPGPAQVNPHLRGIALYDES